MSQVSRIVFSIVKMEKKTIAKIVKTKFSIVKIVKKFSIVWIVKIVVNCQI